MKIEETGQKCITLYKDEVLKLLEEIGDRYGWKLNMEDISDAVRNDYHDREFSFLTDAEEN